MGQLDEARSSSRMGKSSSTVKKSSSTKGKKGGAGGSECWNFSNPKVQGVLLVGLLAVLAAALWFGFSHGCLRRRRRRRPSPCCHFHIILQKGWNNQRQTFVDRRQPLATSGQQTVVA
ncbi:hypothetical protein B5X24_HaOG201309 [Helicoverpa armigera]|nr:hypothetical protein B5X24_HaOG201309 [Helicoverpa armigera]